MKSDHFVVFSNRLFFAFAKQVFVDSQFGIPK